jgi:hypothetical protein
MLGKLNTGLVYFKLKYILDCCAGGLSNAGVFNRFPDYLKISRVDDFGGGGGGK